MAKYRKKPVVVEAEQWFPPGDSQHVPGRFEIRPVPRGDLALGKIYRQRDFYYIATLEGPLRLSPGDWIITGVAGERYPCKPDIFAKTYEPA